MGASREKMIGLRDVARVAGVSVSTVSMALANHPHVNDETKRRIRAMAREMGYRRPRRSINREKRAATNAPRRFGFMLVGSPLQDEAHLGTLHALTVAATDQGARMEIQTFDASDETSDAVDQTLSFASSLDGLVITGLINARLLEELEAAAVPHIVFGHPMNPQPANWGRYGQIVAADAGRMGERATQHLLSRGCERIAFICERMPAGLWADRWHRGYRLALLDAGAAFDPDLTIVTQQPHGGGGVAAEILCRMKPAKRPDGYVVPDTRVAGTLVMTLQDRAHAPVVDHLVVGGQKALLNRYGLSETPWIGYRLDTFATAAIRQLQSLCSEPMPCATELLLPLETTHFGPGPDANAYPPTDRLSKADY